MAHSGFTAPTIAATSIINRLPSVLAPTLNLYKHAMTGPFPGITAVVGGMTWARCSIFYGSDFMKASFKEKGVTNPLVLNVLPSFAVSTFVQVANMPLIRATITQQDPSLKSSAGKTPSTIGALKHLYKEGGVNALWHGTSAGLLKTVPKYMVSIMVKDLIMKNQKEANQEIIDGGGDVTSGMISRQSAFKALVAGVCGAVLTNPADVIRNEMFKCNNSTFMGTLKQLTGGTGQWRWMLRGVDKNLVAVAAPISTMIFLTDLFEEFGEERLLKRRITKIA